MTFPFGLHPKVAWPAIVNAALTVIAAVIAALLNHDTAAVNTAIAGGAATLIGLITGYTVPGPSASTTANPAAGSVTTVPPTGAG